MPAIIKEDKQIIALNEIENALSVIKDINTAVQEGNLFSISAAAPNERGATKIAITDEKDTLKIEAILVGYRAKLIKEVNTKAAKYRIGLDEDDLACSAVGGTFIRIAPGSGSNINIMEIRKKDDSDEAALSAGGGAQNSILMQKIQQLHTFFSLLVKDITAEETQALDEALLKTYERFGITHRNKSLYDPMRPGHYKTMPTLKDLHATMEKIDSAKRLRSYLTRYVTGSAKSFSQQTNVSLDNKYVILDVSTLTDEMLPIGMFIALDYVWDKVRENRTTKKCVIVDETWKLVGSGSSAQAAKFVLEIFKVIRGYAGSAVCATQDLVDFFALEDGIYGQGIVNNAKTKLLMKTEPKEAETVAKAMDLSASEMQEIKGLKRGVCLLAANANHAFIDVKASDLEHELITTDRSDLKKIAMRNTAKQAEKSKR